MKKRNYFIVLLLLFVAFFGINSVKADEPVPVSENLVLSTIERTWQGHNIVLYLENTSLEPITISGEILVSRGQFEPLNRDMDILPYEDGENITINAGEKIEFVQVSAGNPMTWRNFYHSTVGLKLSFLENDVLVETNDAVTTIIYEYQHLTRESWDLIYFPGETFEFSITNLPRSIDEEGYIQNEGNSFTTGRVYFYMYHLDEPHTPYEFFEGMTEDVNGFYLPIDNVENGSFSMEAVFKDNIPLSFLGYRVVLTDDVEDPFSSDAKPFGQVDWRDETNSVFVWVLSDIPSTIGGIEIPNMNQLTNLYETQEQVTFSKSGVGSITFEPGLNIFENIEQLQLLEMGLKINYSQEEKTLKAEVDTASLTFLANHQATITFFNAMETLGLEGVTSENLFDYISINVNDGGVLVDDLSDYLDINNIIYDPDTDTLIIPVNHFTEYIIGLAETTDETVLPTPAVPIVQTGVKGINFLLSSIFVLGALLVVNKKKYEKKN